MSRQNRKRRAPVRTPAPPTQSRNTIHWRVLCLMAVPLIFALFCGLLGSQMADQNKEAQKTKTEVEPVAVVNPPAVSPAISETFPKASPINPVLHAVTTSEIARKPADEKRLWESLGLTPKTKKASEFFGALFKLDGAVAQGRPRGPRVGPKPVEPIDDGPLYVPRDPVRLAENDSRHLSEVFARLVASGVVTTNLINPNKVRYLTLYNIKRADRELYARILSFVCNSLSTKPSVVPLLPRADDPARLSYRSGVVPDTDGILIRLYLDDFGWTEASFNKLAENGSGDVDRRLPDPYFHITKLTETRVDKVGEYTNDAGETKNGSYYFFQKVKTLEVAPWLLTPQEYVQFVQQKLTIQQTVVGKLCAYTNTTNPILRGDWFLVFATVAPAYYDFLNVGDKEKDFQNLVFFDEKLIQKAGTDVRGAVTKSKVALNNRALVRYPTVGDVFGGYYWESLDYKKSTEIADTLNNLLSRKPDAKEIIASLRNGGQAYFVVNQAGKRLDDADFKIAQDYHTALQDKTVFTGRSCMYCHDQGLQFIADKVRKLSRNQIGLMVVDPVQAERIQQLYFKYDLTPVIQRDNAMYAAFIINCNNLRTSENASAFGRFTVDYLDGDVNISRIAMDVGVPPDKLLMRLRKAVGVDHTVTSLLQTPIEDDLRRDQYEEKTFPQLMIFLQQQEIAEAKLEVPK